jgi:hypothetical protein
VQDGVVSEIITPLGGKVRVFPTSIYPGSMDWQGRDVPEGGVALILGMADPQDGRSSEIILSPENCAALIAELTRWTGQ